MKLMKLNLLIVMSISAVSAAEKRPNILFAIADDMSYPFASAYGAKCVSTPAFDRVAKMGVLCNNAYVTSPGSSPSRASILTGCYTWQIEQAGTHGSIFPSKLVTYTDLLREAGYVVAYTGKGWSPGSWKGYRDENPAGTEYNDIRLAKPVTMGIWNYDYFENFKYVLENRKEGQPFCFWYGGKEAHRNYEQDSYKRFGKKLEDAEVPAHLPDTKAVRGDIMDYSVEVEHFDSHLGMMLDYLEKIGELDNTIIVVTADNGMPFPSSKANCFDPGVHVPMAICMGDKFKRTDAADEVVSTINLAATFLDIAGVDVPENMVSSSLLPWLRGEDKKGDDIALFARERHATARHDNLGFPVRGVRKGDWVYVNNFEPDRWPAGDPYMEVGKGNKKKIVSAFTDIDWSPSKAELLNRREDSEIKPYFKHATAKRPAEELYNIVEDRVCLNNLAGDKAYAKRLKEMRKILMDKLKETHDTRLTTPEVWDKYPGGSSGDRKFVNW